MGQVAAGLSVREGGREGGRAGPFYVDWWGGEGEDPPLLRVMAGLVLGGSFFIKNFNIC